MTLVSVVLGTYNELDNITKLIPAIESIFRDKKIDGEILVVDDSSPDGTGDIVRRFASEYGNVRLFCGLENWDLDQLTPKATNVP